jgi:hypothetical protein
MAKGNNTMRKYVNVYWNVVLPIGLALTAAIGAVVMIYFTEINQAPELDCLRWVGCAICFSAVIAFKWIREMLDRSDEKAFNEGDINE